jgi:predicted house-cleaning NTP pyrophosphatase (Maf/HAM1 superfamily)
MSSRTKIENEVTACAIQQAESTDDFAALVVSFEDMSDQELEARITKEDPSHGRGGYQGGC